VHRELDDLIDTGLVLIKKPEERIFEIGPCLRVARYELHERHQKMLERSHVKEVLACAVLDRSEARLKLGKRTAVDCQRLRHRRSAFPHARAANCTRLLS
jgi:hypothetical protein